MRRWYEPRPNRPDVPKNAPKKNGFIRFFETLWREFFELLKLNLLFLLTCVPVVTIPASLTAMSRVTVTMSEDKNHFLWADYWKAFRRDFGRSLLGGVILLALLAIFGVATRFYYLLMETSRFFVILSGMSACLVIGVLLTGLYFFPMMATVNLPTLQLLKNSCILGFVNIKRSLPALLLFVLLMGLGIGLLPYSAPFALLIMCSLTSLVVVFLCYPAIATRVLEEPEQPAHHDSFEELQSAQVGDFPAPEEEEKGDE